MNQDQVITVRVQDSASDNLKKIGSSLAYTQGLLDKLANSAENMGGTFGNATGQIARAFSVIAGGASEVTKVVNAIDGLKKGYEKVTALMTARTTAMGAQTTAIGAQTTAIGALAAATGAKTTALGKKEIMQKKVNKALALSASGTLTAKRAMQKLSAKTMATTAITGLFTKKMTVATAGKWLLAAAAKGLGAAMTFALGPISWIIAGIIALGAAIVGIVRLFQRFGPAAQRKNREVESLSNTWNRCGDEIRAEMKEYNLTTAEWEAKQTEALQAVADQWGMSTDDILAEMEHYGLSLEEWAANQDKAFAQLQEDIRSHTGSIVNNFRELPNELDKSHEEIAAMLQRNREIYNQWSRDIVAIGDKVCDEVLHQLESLGTAGSQLLQDALDPGSEGYEAAWAVIQQLEAGVADATAHAKGTMPPYGAEAADAYCDGFGDGMNNIDSSTVTDPLEYVVEAGIEVAEQGGEEIGVRCMAGLEKGLADGAPGVYDEVDDIVENVLAGFNDGFETASPSRAMKVIGRFVVQGLMLGMESQESPLNNVVTRLANGALNRIRRTLQINSPSRVMHRLGGFTMEGFADGMKSQQKNVEGVAEDAADSVQDGFKDAMLKQKQLHSMLAKQQKTQMKKAAESAGDAIPEEFGRAVMMQKKLHEVSEKLLATKKKFAQSAASFVQTGVQQAFNMQQKLQMMLAKQQKRQEAQVENVAGNAANSVQESFRHAMAMQEKLKTMTKTLYLAQKGFAGSISSLMQDGVAHALSMQKQLQTMLTKQEIKHQLQLDITPHDALQQSSMMERLIAAVEAGKHIVMDSGELVGATYPHYDNAAGQAISYNSRWGR